MRSCPDSWCPLWRSILPDSWLLCVRRVFGRRWCFCAVFGASVRPVVYRSGVSLLHVFGWSAGLPGSVDGLPVGSGAGGILCRASDGLPVPSWDPLRVLPWDPSRLHRVRSCSGTSAGIPRVAFNFARLGAFCAFVGIPSALSFCVAVCPSCVVVLRLGRFCP